MLSSQEPSLSSTTCDSLVLCPAAGERPQLLPWSWLTIMCDVQVLSFSRPLNGTTSEPSRVWTPRPGAGHVVRHSFGLVCVVMSIGFDQVTPSSSLVTAWLWIVRPVC